jgi:hypothetical protein
MEEPLAAPEWAVMEWEKNRTVISDGTSRKRKAEIIRRNNNGRVIVPRRR